MKNEDYAYAVARIRANEVHLLSKSDIEALITAEDLDQAVSLLCSKGWTARDGGEICVGDIISNQNKALWALLCESVPDKSELEIFTVQNDFYNIKAALKCMFSQKAPDGLFAYPTSLDTETVKEAVASRDFSKLGEAFESAAREAYEAANRTQSGQFADIILDRAALMYMSEKASASKCALVSEITDFLCTAANIKIALRCAKTNKSLSFAQNAIAPCGDLDAAVLSELCVKGENELVSFLQTTKFKKAAELITTDTAAFEKWCDDEVTELAKKAKMIFFGFEPICAYYYAKSAELKTVRLILCAKESGLPEEVIRERVRELYV